MFMDAPLTPPASSIGTPASRSPDDQLVSSGKNWKEYMGVVALLVVVGALAFWSLSNGASPVSNSISNPTGLVTAGASVPSEKDTLVESEVDVSQTLSRQTFFNEAYAPNREAYRIFENASNYTGKSLEQMPVFFSLNSEEEIFAALPPMPNDFGEIAYLLATGRFFAIDELDESYFLQPELYPGFKENGLRFWTRPDATSWATNGYGTYPSEQFAEISRGEDSEFEATIFIYSSFGVQTYQGITLFADAESLKKFDLEITPNTFVLEPNFPKFGKEWAKKIVIRGHPKVDTPAGVYPIAINIGVPPADKQKEWSLLYRSLYMDGASGIRPSGNQIVLTVTVK